MNDDNTIEVIIPKEMTVAIKAVALGVDELIKGIEAFKKGRAAYESAFGCKLDIPSIDEELKR